MSRLESDKAKLVDAVAIYRTNANLHDNSSDEALIGYAHRSGKKKPMSDMVRNAWHDFEQGRRYAGLEVRRYVIDYREPREPAPIVDDEEVSGEAERSQGVGSDVKSGRGDDVSDESAPNPFCHHKVRLNDGKEIVCDDCGEVLGPAPEIQSLKTEPAPSASKQPAKKKSTRKKPATATDPPDEEELLF